MGSYECCIVNSSKAIKFTELSSILKLISENNRLQILCILKNGEHCVCQLMGHTILSQSLISHHLKDLKEAEIIIDRKQGKWVYYSLTPKGKRITNLLFKITTKEVKG
jgi:ArsR family transcriptional regulator